MKNLLAAVSEAWKTAPEATKVVLRKIHGRVGSTRVLRLAREGRALLETLSQTDVQAAVRSLVMRQARRFGLELTQQEADAVASFFLSMEDAR